MAIKDIKFMNGEGYLLKELSLSLTQYEEQMRQIEYDRFYDQYRSCRDDSGVEKTQFPSIIFAFYSIIFNQSKLPLPSELLDEYYMINADELQIEGEMVLYQGKPFKKADLDARILRTYPSLVRDYHFYLMLVNAECFDRVIYSCKYDISGKDIIIQDHSKEYILSLYINTNRSNYFKRIKNTFRHIYHSNEIQIPLDLSTAAKHGDIYVYSNEDIENVKNTIYKKRGFTPR